MLTKTDLNAVHLRPWGIFGNISVEVPIQITNGQVVYGKAESPSLILLVK